MFLKRRTILIFLLIVIAIIIFYFSYFIQPQEVMMKLSSPAFAHQSMIPRKYTCQGEDINPPLTISEIPEGTLSLALINDDPDAPLKTWDHWLVWNILPTTTEIKENSVPGIQGKNSWGRNDYGGACPPSGTHRYFFKLYALNTKLDLPEGATKAQLTQSMKTHILAQTELIGLYQKS